jgi:uncharacterized membrane protein
MRRPIVEPLMSAQRRVLIALIGGLVVGVAIAVVGPWQLAVLAGFDAWALLQVVWLALVVLPLDAPSTQARARAEDDSKAAASFAVIAAALVSLLGMIAALAKAQQVEHAEKALLTSLALITVVLAWLTVHMVFVLRYADLYYNGEIGGIDFNDETAPDYRDFAYLGFTVGMTYQVSDTNIHSREIRRAITVHALTSFVFGTVIIGVTINIMAGFIR